MLSGLNRHYRAQLLQGIRPNVVHIHGVWSPYLAAFALTAIRNRIPLIIAPHGMLEPWSLGVNPARKSLAMTCYQREILQGADALHATSTMEADNLRRLEFGNVPIFVIPNAVADPCAPRHSATAKTGEKKTLLFLSRVHQKKGLDILLEAWSEVRPAGWRLLIVGSGEHRYLERLKRLCASRPISDVEFKGHLDGRLREEVFSQASAFILPTFSENFGNVVAEALIRSLPVITTTGTPWSEIVDRNCGWYVTPTVGAIKQAIVEATGADGEALRHMGARGREYAVSHFSLPVIREGLLAMYRSAMQGTTQRTPAT
jgi:glycosyltransferase involved in cell wall biosynthesis